MGSTVVSGPSLNMYPHVRLNVGDLGSANSALIVFDSSVLSSVVFEEFCQRVEFEMTIRTFVAPLHFQL